MQLLSASIAFLLASSASADFVAAKSVDQGENVDLGYLEDVNAFYSLIGYDPKSNNSHWEDVTEFESLTTDDGFQSIHPATNEETGLIKRDDYCSDTTGITRMVCENVPSRNWFWGAGGALIIYYAPRVLTNWLNVCVNICRYTTSKSSHYMSVGRRRHDRCRSERRPDLPRWS